MRSIKTLYCERKILENRIQALNDRVTKLSHLQNGLLPDKVRLKNSKLLNNLNNTVKELQSFNGKLDNRTKRELRKLKRKLK